MAEVKGVLVNAMRAFLRERYGNDAVQRAAGTLAPDDAALIQRKFLDSSFYPYATMVALRRLTRAVAPDARSTPDELGAFIAEYVFKGVYKPLLPASPVAMVEKMSWVKDFFYRDTDKIEAHMTGGSSCVVTYQYEEGIRPTHAVCKSTAGFWGRTLELAGATKVRREHPACIADGAERCQFTFSW